MTSPCDAQAAELRRVTAERDALLARIERALEALSTDRPYSCLSRDVGAARAILRGDSDA